MRGKGQRKPGFRSIAGHRQNDWWWYSTRVRANAVVGDDGTVEGVKCERWEPNKTKRMVAENRKIGWLITNGADEVVSLCGTYVSRVRAGLGSKGDCVPKSTYSAGGPFLLPRSNKVHCQAAS